MQEMRLKVSGKRDNNGGCVHLYLDLPESGGSIKNLKSAAARLDPSPASAGGVELAWGQSMHTFLTLLEQEILLNYTLSMKQQKCFRSGKIESKQGLASDTDVVACMQ